MNVALGKHLIAPTSFSPRPYAGVDRRWGCPRLSRPFIRRFRRHSSRSPRRLRRGGAQPLPEILPLAKNALRGGILGGLGDFARPHLPAWWIRRELMRHFANVVCHRAAIESFASSYAFLLASDSVDFERAPREPLMACAGALEGELRLPGSGVVPIALPPPELSADALDGVLRHPRTERSNGASFRLTIKAPPRSARFADTASPAP